MKATLRKMGNSQGVLIPKAIVDQLGIVGALEMSVEDGALVLRVPTPGGNALAVQAQKTQEWLHRAIAATEAADPRGADLKQQVREATAVLSAAEGDAVFPALKTQNQAIWALLDYQASGGQSQGDGHG